MKAWTLNTRGLTSQVLRLSTLPSPQVSSLPNGEALIKVSHVSLAQGASLIAKLFPHFSSQGMVPEPVFAGRVVAMNPSDDKSNKSDEQDKHGNDPGSHSNTDQSSWDVHVSDEVMGFVPVPRMLTRSGALAEYIAVPLSAIVRKPTNLSAAEASGVPGNTWTAIGASEAASVKKGDKVLVNGASGGLGSMLVQVLRECVGPEGTVVGVCSGANEDLARELGCDEVVDYTLHNPLHVYMLAHHTNPPFTAIFDVAGNKALHDNCPGYLSETGHYELLGDMHMVANASWFNVICWLLRGKTENLRPVIFGGVPRRHRMHNALIGQEELRRSVEVIERGKVRVLVDGVYKMEDAVKAYQRVETQRARGKVVIAVEE